MEKDRYEGIDLLRILLTFYICIVHIIKQGGVLSTSKGSSNFYAFVLVEAIVYCAVNGYGLISGYVSKSKKNNYKRIVLILLEAFFYSFVVTVVLRLFKIGNPISIEELLQCAFPFIYDYYWYITAYFPLFFLMPYINKFVEELDKKQALELFVILVIIFSILGSINDNYTESGFSFLWLTILYVIGSIMRKMDMFRSMNKTKLVIMYLLCVAVSFLVSLFFNSNLLISYISPTMLFAGMALVSLFSRIKIDSKVTRLLSSLCLGIYLLQNNAIIWNSIFKGRFVSIANYNGLIGIILVFGCGLGVFLICGIIDYIRLLIFKILHLDSLASYIGKLIDKLISSLAKFVTKVD